MLVICFIFYPYAFLYEFVSSSTNRPYWRWVSRTRLSHRSSVLAVVWSEASVSLVAPGACLPAARTSSGSASSAVSASAAAATIAAVAACWCCSGTVARSAVLSAESRGLHRPARTSRSMCSAGWNRFSMYRSPGRPCARWLWWGRENIIRILIKLVNQIKFRSSLTDGTGAIWVY